MPCRPSSTAVFFKRACRPPTALHVRQRHGVFKPVDDGGTRVLHQPTPQITPRNDFQSHPYLCTKRGLYDLPFGRGQVPSLFPELPSVVFGRLARLSFLTIMSGPSRSTSPPVIGLSAAGCRATRKRREFGCSRTYSSRCRHWGKSLVHHRQLRFPHWVLHRQTWGGTILGGPQFFSNLDASLAKVVPIHGTPQP